MKYREIDQSITTLLANNEAIRRVSAQPPEVMHIPFMGTREHFFLLVSLFVLPDMVKQEKLLNECIAVARIAIQSGLLTDEKAVEIAAYVTEHTKVRRVIRLTVLDTAYSQTMTIDASDLLSKQHEGITCLWPLQNPQ